MLNADIENGHGDVGVEGRVGWDKLGDGGDRYILLCAK